MKTSNYFNLLFFLAATAFLFSCAGEPTKPMENPIQEPPKVLQDDKMDIKSYSRSNSDLTEELYADLVEKNPELKKLEDALEAFSPKPNELKQKYNTYEGKSNSYYSSAESKAGSISDSLLKSRIFKLIATSKNKYANKTTELNALLKTISQNETTLNDHHTVLKIVLTQPIIEKFQTDNLPDKKEFKETIKEQGKLVQQTDGLTPKY